MGRALDLFRQPLPYRPRSPRGATLSVAKKDERVALIFWARTAPVNAETSSPDQVSIPEGDLLLISWGELRRSDDSREAPNPCSTQRLAPGSGKSGRGDFKKLGVKTGAATEVHRAACLLGGPMSLTHLVCSQEQGNPPSAEARDALWCYSVTGNPSYDFVG
jgi:hypothetical protein